MDGKTLQRIKPLLITAPSGCGKGTLITRLVSDYGHIFKSNVSYTTRAPRNGEVHGVHRFFVSMDEFTKAIEDNKLIEFAKYADNYYGTHRDYINSIIADNKICIIEVEVQGAKSISNTDLECNFLFIEPPSFDALRDRLLHRGTETPERIAKRMEAAKWELDEAAKSGIFPTKLVNDDFETFYAEVKKYLRTNYPAFEF